jgi:hypothetical protein
VSGVAVPTRAMARAVLAGAIVAALFFMHGAAVGGCSAGVPVMPLSMTTGVPVMSGTTGPAGAIPPAVDQMVSVASTPEHSHGQVCVSTPPRPALAGLLLTGTDVTSIAVQDPALSRPTADPHSRAPPHGVELLVVLCVSRT